MQARSASRSAIFNCVETVDSLIMVFVSAVKTPVRHSEPIYSSRNYLPSTHNILLEMIAVYRILWPVHMKQNFIKEAVILCI